MTLSYTDSDSTSIQNQEMLWFAAHDVRSYSVQLESTTKANLSNNYSRYMSPIFGWEVYTVLMQW